MKLFLTRAAESDLENIADFIAQDNPVRAVTFVHELVAAAQQLIQYPNAYPLVFNMEKRGIRRRSYGNYIIFYAVRPDKITIVRILNAAQDYDVILSTYDT